MSSLHFSLPSLKQWSTLIAVCAGLHAPLGRLQAQSWYNSAWANRKSITINHGQVSGSSNLASFPVLISLPSDSNLASPGAQANGNDILFTASDGTTKLYHEIESFNSSTGQLTAWVQLQTLSPSNDTTIYMYYGIPPQPTSRMPPPCGTAISRLSTICPTTPPRQPCSIRLRTPTMARRPPTRTRKQQQVKSAKE